MANLNTQHGRSAVVIPYRLIAGVTVTLLVVALAAIGATRLWRYYNIAPWTRDGRVRADVVQVSPDVNGLVTDVNVHDDQVVHKGQVLFVLDKPRYQIALRLSEAAILAAQAALDEAMREDRRNHALNDLVTAEQREEGTSKVLELRAQLKSALVQKDLARLNLERTTVAATVNGVVTNLELQVGDYAAAGHQVLALMNTDSLYVDGYFEETKLPRIQVGDSASVRIMGVQRAIYGAVESIAAGIEDRERGASSRDLANVNPTFSWVRLAQRIPVRIRLKQVPEGIRLIAGRTATVTIEAPEGRPIEGAR